MSEVLCRDVHPADLALPDGSMLRNVRVFITTDRVIAYQATPDRKVKKVLEEALTVRAAVSASRGTLQGGRLECPVLGGSIFVNRAQGCGCSSPLKALAVPVGWTSRTEALI